VSILGRHIDRLIDPATAELLTTYVTEHGGHVIFARGRPYDDTGPGAALAEPLAPIEPVKWGAGRVTDLSLRITPDGRTAAVAQFTGVTSPVSEIFESLPGFATMTPVTEVKSLTTVLATAHMEDDVIGAKPQAAVVSMPAGRGSVFAVLGEGLHRWSFLSPRLKRYDGVYDTLWSNAVRWLVMGGAFAPGEQVSLRIEPTSVRLGRQVTIDVVARASTQTAFNPSVTLTPVDAAGEPQTLTLSPVPGGSLRLRATVEPKDVGVYRVDVDARPLRPAALTGKFSVYDIDVERLETSANPAGMRQLSEATGGIAFKPDQADTFIDELERLRLAQQVPAQPKYVWDRWWPLVGLLVWVGIEWIVRRTLGLL